MCNNQYPTEDYDFTASVKLHSYHDEKDEVKSHEICLTCFLTKLFINEKTDMAPTSCPFCDTKYTMCKAPCSFSTTHLTQLQSFILTNYSINLYDFIVNYLKCLKPASFTIKNVNREIRKHYSNLFDSMISDSKFEKSQSNILKCVGLKLSIDQVETILQMGEKISLFDGDGYVFRNMFVQMCIFPWKVDVKLGTHGVCYFGNLGEDPTSLFNMLHLLKKNSMYLLGL